MDALVEDSSIKFGSVSEAVIWAERTLLFTGLGSQLRNIVISDKYPDESERPPIKLGNDNPGETAQTISCKVSHVHPPYAGKLYRYLCGANDMKLAHQASREISISIKSQISAPRTPISKIENLALQVMIAERKRMQFGERTSADRLANNVGMTRHAFAKQPWSDARLVTYEIIHQWVDESERQLGKMLSDVGVL